MLPVTAGYPGDRSAKRAAESPVDDPSGGPQAGKFEPRDELSATCRQTPRSARPSHGSRGLYSSIAGLMLGLNLASLEVTKWEDEGATGPEAVALSIPVARPAGLPRDLPQAFHSKALRGLQILTRYW